MAQEFKSKSEFKKFMLKLSASAVVAISIFTSSGEKIGSFQNQVQNVMQMDASYSGFPLWIEGEHSITVSQLDDGSDSGEDISHSVYALAFASDVALTGSVYGARIGSLTDLRSELSDFDAVELDGRSHIFHSQIPQLVQDMYTSKLNEAISLGITGHDSKFSAFWILMPIDPFEQKKLMESLQEHAEFYVTPTGNETPMALTPVNASLGGGLGRHRDFLPG